MKYRQKSYGKYLNKERKDDKRDVYIHRFAQSYQRKFNNSA